MGSFLCVHSFSLSLLSSKYEAGVEIVVSSLIILSYRIGSMSYNTREPSRDFHHTFIYRMLFSGQLFCFRFRIGLKVVSLNSGAEKIKYINRCSMIVLNLDSNSQSDNAWKHSSGLVELPANVYNKAMDMHREWCRSQQKRG